MVSPLLPPFSLSCLLSKEWNQGGDIPSEGEKLSQASRPQMMPRRHNLTTGVKGFQEKLNNILQKRVRIPAHKMNSAQDHPPE
jgi:hypothetical protein